jgi:hypothetical protein
LTRGITVLILCGIAGGQKQVYVLIAKIIKTAQAAQCICGMKKETILRYVYISKSENYTIERLVLNDAALNSGVHIIITVCIHRCLIDHIFKGNAG